MNEARKELYLTRREIAVYLETLLLDFSWKMKGNLLRK